MRRVKCAPNLMQRLSGLPPAPNVTLLQFRKTKSLPWLHANTTFAIHRVNKELLKHKPPYGPLGTYFTVRLISAF
jgi:hypothetical protein